MLRLLQDAGWPDQSAAAAAAGGELGEGANENEPVWVLRDSYMKKMVRDLSFTVMRYREIMWFNDQSESNAMYFSKRRKRRTGLQRRSHPSQCPILRPITMVR